MPDKSSARLICAPIGGIILLFLGVVFFLQTTGTLPWGLWQTLWRFWPVTIIIIGLGILLRRYNVWLVSLLILGVLGASLGIAFWQYESLSPSSTLTRSYSEPLGTLERAQLEIDFSTGKIIINGLPAGSASLIEVDSESDLGRGIDVDRQRQDKGIMLRLSTEETGRRFEGRGTERWMVGLNRDIPLTLKVKTAVSSMELDLSQLNIEGLTLDIDVNSSTITLPASAGITDIDLKSGCQQNRDKYPPESGCQNPVEY